MNGDQCIVVCDRVTRRFEHGAGSVVAVRDVSCSIAAGARVAIVGPSGSGKSTLLHLVAGLDDPTEGTVSWPELGNHPTLRPGPIAVVFQAPSLIPALNVLENVALPLVLAGTTEDAAHGQARDALDRLELGDIGARLPEEISGGQAQRVAVARALVATPALILADEPTGQLDAATAAIVTTALLDTADHTGAALVVATHDPLVADRFDDRWLMRDGSLEIQATEVIPCSR